VIYLITHGDPKSVKKAFEGEMMKNEAWKNLEGLDPNKSGGKITTRFCFTASKFFHASFFIISPSNYLITHGDPKSVKKAFEGEMMKNEAWKNLEAVKQKVHCFCNFCTRIRSK
jgi:hypothetical protein